MKKPFFDRLAEIDKLIERGPADCDFLRDIKPLLQEEASEGYFYGRLQNPKWLDVLIRAGKFRKCPAPQKDPEKGTIGFPPWSESQFLVRMATLEPETVLEVTLLIPETENVRIHEELADIALTLPPNLSVKLVSKATSWIESPYQTLLPEKLGKLVSHLAQGGEADAALDLASALLALRMPEKTKKDELCPRFDIWHYKNILSKHIPDLVAAAGERTLTLFCNLLEDAISYKAAKPNDFSYLWRPAIEDHSLNSGYDVLKDGLVTSVRNAAEQVVKQNRDKLPEMVRILEDRSWNVFHRLALHLLRIFPENAPELIAERLTDYKLFDIIGFHEHALLLKDQFANLDPDDQAKILGWIDKGPGIEKLKADRIDKQPTDEEITRRVKIWKIEKLAKFSVSLPDEWKRRYAELVAELGQKEYPEFDSYTTEWVGPTSPKSAKELKSMSLEEIHKFLKDWKPSGDTMSPSPEGLARELAAVVAEQPEPYAKKANLFRDLNPIYIRALLWGLRDAAKNKSIFSWSTVLDLCRWLVKQPRDNGESADREKGWGLTWKAIAELLSEGFEQSKEGPEQVPVVIPNNLREAAWEALEPLTEDPDPTPEYEKRYGGSNLDPVSMSINTTRGEAMHAVIRYALWVRYNIKKSKNKKDWPDNWFVETPEVREVLDRHLDPDHDPALSIRAVYGQWFPWLVSLDQDWVTKNLVKIFPMNESSQELRNAAWEAYIILCRPYDNVFEVLQEEYRRAIERIGTISRKKTQIANPDECLAQHLMSLYGGGKLNLDDQEGLLAQFYRKASDKLCAHAMETAGFALYRTKEPVENEVINRLKALWDRRLSEARSMATSHTAELSAFGWWFASAKFDNTWAINQLKGVLNIVNKIEHADFVVEHLAKIARVMPAQAVECLGMIVEGEKEGAGVYIIKENARAILKAAICSSNDAVCQAGKDLVNRLGALGFLEYRDLI
jgi:hypothetical protein